MSERESIRLHWIQMKQAAEARLIADGPDAPSNWKERAHKEISRAEVHRE